MLWRNQLHVTKVWSIWINGRCSPQWSLHWCHLGSWRKTLQSPQSYPLKNVGQRWQQWNWYARHFSRPQLYWPTCTQGRLKIWQKVTYSPSSLASCGRDPSPSWLDRLLSKADEYHNMEGLKIMCEEALTKLITARTAIDILQLATTHNAQDLEKILPNIQC